VRQGDTVVEVGANIGSHTVMLSQAVGDSGVVFAFEPQRHVFQVLCANLVINHCLNVRANQCAIGDTDGTIDFPAIDP
ncbi:FkbM family methyltransferase, partial [Bacillus sp. SIMBA_006]